MARAEYIQSSLNDWLGKFHFFTEVKVRYCETDMSGHVNNTSYFSYFEHVRAEYLDSIRFYSSPVTIVTADLWCHYHSEAHFLDTLKVGARVSRLGNKSFDMEYCIVAANNQLIATATGSLVVIDKETKRSTTLPDDIRNAILEREGLHVVI